MLVDNLLIYATALVFGVIAFIACMNLTPAKRLSIAAFLAIPQFFIPSLPVTVADVWVGFMAVAAIADKRVQVTRPAFLVPVFGLAFAYTLAQFWSEAPFSQGNMLVVVRVLLFAVIACYALTVASENPKTLLSSLRWATPWIVIQSVLTIAFKLSPVLENTFLHSSIGQVLVGPSAAGLFNGFANNVLDPVKAGGLFVNANVASMFLGVAFFVALAAIRAGASPWYRLVALFAWVGVWATGSKTGAALAIALPVAAFLVPRMSRGLSRIALIPIALILVPVTIGLPDLITTFAPEYAENSVTAYGSRSVLWDAAAILFIGSPWLGLGFGGWAINIASLLGFDNLPPHNLIIASWANAGMLAALAVVALIVAVAWIFIKAIFSAEDSQVRKTLTCALCALAWIFIHGMGDNTTIYGESKTALLTAVSLAFIYAIKAEPSYKPDSALGANKKPTQLYPSLGLASSQARR